MIGRVFSNGDVSLPTHSSSHGSSGYSSPRQSTYARTDSSPKYNKKRNAGNGYSTLTYTVIAMVVLNIIFTSLWMSSKGQYRSLLKAMNARDVKGVIDKIHWTEREIESIRRKMDAEVREAERRFSAKIKKLENDNLRYKKERHDLREEYESEEFTTRMEKREPAYQQQIGRMQQAIRKESKRTVLERFGIGPHHVQMTFIFQNTEYEFEIELAPLTVVPHAVHLFLEQVDHGLWNNTYFYANTLHVLQAGPSHPNGLAGVTSGVPGNIQKFKEKELDTLAFPDFSFLFPHYAWTVGFASRPGGPDWFINKIDNIEAHGPGGQTHYALEEQGDSCFGRIVKGREHIEKLLFPLPTVGTSDFPSFLKEQVLIKQAIILTPKSDAELGINLEEIPEPAEFQFGRSLRDALDPVEQSTIEQNTIEIHVPEETSVDASSTESVATSDIGTLANDENNQQQVQHELLEQQQITGATGAAAQDVTEEQPKQEALEEPAVPPKVEGTPEAFVLGASAMDFGENY